MESEVEIIEIPKKNHKKTILIGLALFLTFLIIFFGYRAFSFTKKIIVSKSSSASPYLSGERDLGKFESGDRRINILLLGMGGENHPGGNLTDTIQVASIDPKNKEVSILSIPRDLFVKVDGFGSYKINSVFSLNEKGSFDSSLKEGEDSDNRELSKKMDLMKKTVSGLLGVPIHYTALINFDGFKKIIDIFDGIDVEVKKDLYDPYYPDEYVEDYDPFYIESGTHHMDGETALKYVRSRETTSDFDRSRRQQEIMVAVKDKAIKNISMKKVSQIMNILSDNFKTDLQLSEIEELIKIAKDIDSQNIKTTVLDDGEEGLLYSDRYDEMYVLVPVDPTLSELHFFVSQYFRDPLLAEEKAKISIVNGTNNEYYPNYLLEKLKYYNYDVTLSEKNDDKIYEKTFIYDYSNNKKKGTIDFLKKYLGNVSIMNLGNQDHDYDIEIIIGKNYQGKTIK